MPDQSAQHHQVVRNLTNHSPSPEAIDTISRLRCSTRQFAHVVVDLCPDSREKSLAQTNIEQALMWAVAAIARDGH